MDTRLFPALGREIPVIGTGTWQLGIDLSEVDPSRAFSNLDAACASGVTFIDTADAYDNGASERFLGEFLSARPRTGLTVATKMGRSSGEKTYPTDAFSRDRVLHWNDRSRKNLGTETIDIVHLHAPPIELLQRRHLWELLDELVETERIRCYGVSVLTCAEALEAIQHPGCASVEIIVNVFRHKPLEGVLPAARKSGTAVIARVPLPDGLLSHNRRRSSTPAPPGSVAALDAGWIYSVVPDEVGMQAAHEFSDLCRQLGPEHVPPVQVALRWLLDQEGITCILPDAHSLNQVRSNARAAELPPLSQEMHTAVRELYDRLIKPYVHQHW